MGSDLDPTLLLLDPEEDLLCCPRFDPLPSPWDLELSIESLRASHGRSLRQEEWRCLQWRPQGGG